MTSILSPPVEDEETTSASSVGAALGAVDGWQVGVTVVGEKDADGAAVEEGTKVGTNEGATVAVGVGVGA